MNDKKEKLVNSAILLFAQEGLSVPTSRVAKEAGVSNGTLFNYFATKQDLIDQLYFLIKKEMATVMMSELDWKSSTRQFFFSVWSCFINWGVANRNKYKVCMLLKGGQLLSDDVQVQTMELFAPLSMRVQRAFDEGELKDLPMDFVMKMTNVQMDAVIDYAQECDVCGDALDKFITSGFDVYWDGISR